MARPPAFLAPAGYRRKRVRDSARLLPALGVAFLLVPLLWARSDAPGGVGNAAALLYLFGVWAALILAAVLLARLLMRDGGDGAGGEEE